MERSSLPLAGSAGLSRALRCEAVLRACSLGAVAVIAVAVPLVPMVFGATKVTVKLGGEIARVCTMTGLGQGGTANASLTVDDITKVGAKDFSFTLDCNAPFAYSVEAQHGALQNQTVSAASPGFVTRVPYSVSVYIPTDAGAIDDTCSGESIRAGAVTCAFSNSGNGIALAAAGQLRLAWVPGGTPMVGTYGDVLTITVGVRG